jgi:hypothetical protein
VGAQRGERQLVLDAAILAMRSVVSILRAQLAAMTFIASIA